MEHKNYKLDKKTHSKNTVDPGQEGVDISVNSISICENRREVFLKLNKRLAGFVQNFFLAYLLGRAQPAPKLTTPTTVASDELRLATSGPPESPCKDLTNIY